MASCIFRSTLCHSSLVIRPSFGEKKCWVKAEWLASCSRRSACRKNLKKGAGRNPAHGSRGQAGAGMVKITMTGKHDCKRVQIDAGVMDDKKCSKI